MHTPAPPSTLTVEELHDLVRARLRAPDVNLSQIARDAQIARPMLYEVRQPGSNPQAKTLERVAHALGIRVTVT